MIQTKQDLIQSIQANREKILSFGVDRLGLFGSFVRNEMNEKSDVDLLVEFQPEKKTFRNLFYLADFLEEETGRKVEVVTKEGLSKYFGPKIIAETEYVL